MGIDGVHGSRGKKLGGSVPSLRSRSQERGREFHQVMGKDGRHHGQAEGDCDPQAHGQECGWGEGEESCQVEGRVLTGDKE